MIEINLINNIYDKEERSGKKKGFNVFLVLLIIEIIAIGLISVDANIRLTKLNAEYSNLRNIEKEVAKIQHKIKEVRVMVFTIKELKNNRNLPVRILQGIADDMPNNLWLKNLSKKDDNVYISGDSFTTEAVAHYMSNLGDLNYVKKVSFFDTGLIKNVAYNNPNVYSFDLRITLK